MSTRGTAVFRDIAVGASAIVIALTGLGFFGLSVAHHALKWHDGVGMMINGQNGNGNDREGMMGKGKIHRGGPNTDAQGNNVPGGGAQDRNNMRGKGKNGLGDDNGFSPPDGMMGGPNGVNPGSGGMMGTPYHNWGNTTTPPTS